MSDNTLSTLRLERDKLRAELTRLNASIDVLRPQQEEEAQMLASSAAELETHEKAVDAWNSRAEELRVRYQQLVAEERHLRELVDRLYQKHDE